jgi:DUF971 family protein
MNSAPKELKKIGQDMFRITWQDDHVSEFSFRYLRQNCPCAGCRNEWTGEKTLDPDSVPEDLKGLKVNIVGNYALQFNFSDRHETGIYSFKYLRSLCICPQCAQAGLGLASENSL